MSSKRGQFYLIAAIVIIVLILGYAAVSNYSRSKTESYARVYNLEEEAGLIRAQVIDRGIIQDIESDNVKELFEGFIQEFSSVGDLDETYFIFGNSQRVVFMGYQKLQELIEIGVGINEGEYEFFKIEKKDVENQKFVVGSEEVEKVSVKINYDENVADIHDFTLRPGENFYIIVSIVEGGEKFIAVEGDEDNIFTQPDEWSDDD